MNINTEELASGQVVWLLMFALIMWAVLTALTIITVVRSAKMPPPMALVVALTAVTLLTIAAFVFTEQQELATLAGMGIGALSGAVAAAWQPTSKDIHQEQRDEQPDDDEQPPPDQPG